MARYFFDMKNGDHASLDEEGGEFATLKDVESEVIKTLADIAHDARSASDIASIGIVVRNKAGQTVLTMSLKLDIVRTKP